MAIDKFLKPVVRARRSNIPVYGMVGAVSARIETYREKRKRVLASMAPSKDRAGLLRSIRRERCVAEQILADLKRLAHPAVQ